MNVRRLVVLLVIVAIFGGCGTSAPGSSSTGTSPDSSGGPRVVGTLGPGASSPHAACTLLAAADIQAVTGLGVQDMKPMFMSGVSDDGCDWTLTDANASEVQLAYVATDARDFFDTYYAPYNSPLAGVGDAAITTDAGAVMAVKGDAVVLVDYIEFPTAHRDFALKLLQAALAHLPS